MRAAKHSARLRQPLGDSARDVILPERQSACWLRSGIRGFAEMPAASASAAVSVVCRYQAGSPLNAARRRSFRRSVSAASRRSPDRARSAATRSRHPRSASSSWRWQARSRAPRSAHRPPRIARPALVLRPVLGETPFEPDCPGARQFELVGELDFPASRRCVEFRLGCTREDCGRVAMGVTWVTARRVA